MSRLIRISEETYKRLMARKTKEETTAKVLDRLIPDSKAKEVPVPEGYELVGEVDIPDHILKQAQKESTKLVPVNIVTDEDLKKRNQIAKEIIGMKGRTLLIAKQNGESWPYTVKDEIPNETLKLLEERREEGSSILGLALFQVSPNSPLLKLISVSL